MKHHADDLFHTPLDQAQIDFENEGGDTYICGNPPYRGSQWQTEEQKSDLKAIFGDRTTNWKSLDYVAGWFMKAADYGTKTTAVAALVSTNSVCQGRQVETLWSLVFSTGHEVAFAHTSFKWANLASYNAGVTVVIVGISRHAGQRRFLFSETAKSGTVVKEVENINAYLVPGPNVIVSPVQRPLGELPDMTFGSMPNDGGYLLLSTREAATAVLEHGVKPSLIRPFVGSQEFSQGIERRCIWVGPDDVTPVSSSSWT